MTTSEADDITVAADERREGRAVVSVIHGSFTTSLRVSDDELRRIRDAIDAHLSTPPSGQALESGWDGSVPTDDYGPWGGTEGCFGHCDPEGWYAQCRARVSARGTVADAESVWEYQPGHAWTDRDGEQRWFVQSGVIAPGYVTEYISEGGGALRRKVGPWETVTADTAIEARS